MLCDLTFRILYDSHTTVDRKSFLFMMLLLTVTIGYGTLTFYIILCCLISKEIILKSISLWFSLAFYLFFIFATFYFIFLTLATEGLIFEIDGNKDMLDIFWQQKKHIWLFWHQ